MHRSKLLRHNIFNLLIVIGLVTNVEGATNYISDSSSINSILRNAKIALDSNNIVKSLKLSRSAFQLSTKSGYTKGIAVSLLLIGRLQSYNGIKDSALLNYMSSLRLYRSLKNESEVGSTLNIIGNVYVDIGNLDSAEYYYNEALKVRKKINDKKGVIATINNLGTIFHNRGMYSKSLEYYFNSLTLIEESGDKNIQSAALNNIGGVYWNQGDYTKALDFFIKSLKLAEELRDIKSAAMIYNNIGLVYSQMDDYEMALKYLNIAFENHQSIKDSTGISNVLVGLGELYHKKKEYSKAVNSYLEAEKIRRKQSDLIGLGNLYVNMGLLYRDMGDLEKSLTSFEEAEAIFITHNFPWGNANSLIQSGLVYSELGFNQKAITKCLKGIDIAKQIGAIDIAKNGYFYLSKVYEIIGNTAQAYRAYKFFVTYRDSINSIEKTKQLFKIQIQAEFDKVSQKQKVEQDSKLILAQSKSIKQTKIANIFMLAFALTLSVSILFFINFRQKQRNNDLLAFQKLDMERQKSELVAQRDELEIQKNLVIHQRDKIMTMLTELGESIDYARKIQQALLPSDKSLEIAIGNYFLLFQPRESVGGDFYWVAQNENLTFFALGDCTGHGVPGGFMSMLGVSLLNELVSRSDCTSPSKILWNLRDMIIKALNQTGLDDDSQDGMDIALCMYNSQNHQLVYSGANLSLVLATTTKFEPSDKVFTQGNIVEFKPDRMPVAYYQRMVEYYEHHIVLTPGDTIYMFSDGYADQFGGPSNKKFGYSTFRNLISSTAKKPFEKQRDSFWYEFDKWKGDENQTDDVIVMGIRIT